MTLTTTIRNGRSIISTLKQNRDTPPSYPKGLGESKSTLAVENERADASRSDTSSSGTTLASRIKIAKAARAKEAEVFGGFRVAGMDRWTGRVVEVDEELFTAELVPHDEGPTVLADFSREQVADSLVPGDVIYVTVRTTRGPGGQPNKTSSVRLRRLGKWTTDDIQGFQERASRRANALKDLID